jgi:hypothetical protein
VNGDGYDDMIVGARDSERAYIFYGGESMDSTADVILTGETVEDWLGYSVSGAGDVNNDGYDDVIVGAPGYYGDKAYIYYGSSSMDSVPDVIFNGEAEHDGFGWSVSGAGDVNDDDFDDVIVGAPYNNAGGTAAGRAYIYYGGSSMDSTADVILTGETDYDHFGLSVSGAEDVNNDGYDDVIVGAHWNDAGGTDAGEVYIFYGGTQMDNTVDVTLTGETSVDEFGELVSCAGDVNGDDYDDVIVGAPYNDDEGNNAGKTYIYTIKHSISMVGEAAGDTFGDSVSGAGDVNGDGYDDVIIGAPLNGAEGFWAGRAYIYYGGSSMDSTADVIFTSEAPGDLFGDSVSGAGDVNGDGYDDVIVSAVGSDAGGPHAGRAYIFYGGSSMDSTADVIFTGEAEYDYFGWAVSGAGDVNGDGYDDVIIDAPFNEAGGTEAGRAYIFYGGSSMDSTADVTLTGEVEYGHFGEEGVSGAGDVNNDGYDDVIIGADNAAYIFYGGGVMDDLSDVIFTGEASGGGFGRAVSGAGDVNNDGYDDVIIGADNVAYIFYGGGVMDDLSDVIFTGEASGDGFGWAVSGAGDVNNDGYDDMIIGAWLNDEGGNLAGKAYIYTIEFINVSMPTVTYDNSSQTIDITGVTAVCSNPAHGTLDNTEATVHIYTIYTSGGSATSVTGILEWTGSEWKALNVDISDLSAGTYYVKCRFEDSDATGTSAASNTFTITTGGGDAGGGDAGGGDAGGGGGGISEPSKSSCILDFLLHCYSKKPGETVTLSGVISSKTNGQLITITFEGEKYSVYTSNNGEFEVTLKVPNTYGIYPVIAKFAGDSNWKSASTTCHVLVVEEETRMNLNIEGNLNKGEQITITVTVTEENGNPVIGEQVTIYIYERKTSTATNKLSLQSSVGTFAADIRYWNLIETLEVTTGDDGTAATEWTVSTDNDIQIVAEYTGKVEGDGGENIGSSTASFVEGEAPRGFVLSSDMTLYLFGAIGAGIAIAVIGVIVVLKRRKEI